MEDAVAHRGRLAPWPGVTASDAQMAVLPRDVHPRRAKGITGWCAASEEPATTAPAGGLGKE